ncbi:MAG TPA: 4Fe-4S binding protein [Deltaproteobacteria bacterium]|jgi:ferredoxin|nr:4Fe-4S binding protein [Deltaproteobacteria bacterium]HOI07427.1 4Fe-4S binding protein [Deltaproteobacteria bacterium]
MDKEIYRKLARVLDTLPNGFPPTESGVELRLLEKIFTPEEAELFCRLRVTFETAAQIAERTGLPLEGLEERLIAMGDKGQIFAIPLGDVWIFRMLPWVFGIFEFQLHRIDEEFARLHEEYEEAFGRQFFSSRPQLMQTLPIEETLVSLHETLPYERVSSLIEHNQSFMVNECVCKKQQALLGHPCDRPLEVCLAMAPVPGLFDNSPNGRVITKAQAYELLKKTEELGLVHLTGNVQNGQIFICNCCRCCCGPLRAINELKVPAGDVINSSHYALIDQDLCIGCGLCAEERCQVGAITGDGEAYRVSREGCIGCGLCIGTCPTGALSLVRKPPEELEEPPVTEMDWFEERSRRRGVDFSEYK